MKAESIGAVAVVDALGFRAARARQGAQTLIDSLKAARHIAKETLSNMPQHTGGEVHYAAFSDTIIMAAVAPPEPIRKIPPLATAVLTVSMAAAALAASAAVVGTPLAFRGCISSGELAAADDVFVGEAIDEAAEWYEQADIAAIWLTPSASKAVKQPLGLFLIEYDLPLKGRGVLKTRMVNPFLYCATPALSKHDHDVEASMTTLRTALLRPFGEANAIDVAIKRQHTEALLDLAMQETRDTLPTWKEMLLNKREVGTISDLVRKANDT